jgi:endo-1,4-beta-xylanase
MAGSPRCRIGPGPIDCLRADLVERHWSRPAPDAAVAHQDTPNHREFPENIWKDIDVRPDPGKSSVLAQMRAGVRRRPPEDQTRPLRRNSVIRTRRRTSRYLAALALTTGAAIGIAVSVAPTGAGAASTLRSAAAAKGRVFGAAVSASHFGEAQYVNTWTSEFSSVTPENEMKWQNTEPNRGQFTFGSADQIVSRAQAAGMKIRGHTLVWHSQLANWVNNINNGGDLQNAMNAHINGVMSHFRGKIQYWDVVNEAFDGANRRNSIFQRLLGNGYIETAFRTARAADPAAKLCYNDFSTDGMNAKSNAVFAMVQDFKRRGVPIDCVGFQSHLIVNQIPGDYQANLQRFANLGVDVNITELDIRMPTPASQANLQAQANNYRTVVAACLAVSRCTSITTWGITDKFSWVPGTFPGQGAALLFDNNYARKAAYNTTLQALGG